MRSRISVATFGLGLLSTFLAAPVTAGESSHQTSPTQYWFCQSSTNEPAYSTPVLVTVASGDTNESIRGAVATTKQDIEKSFAALRLYLVGPFMHPGGGVFGAGRATAIKMFDELNIDFERVASRKS